MDKPKSRARQRGEEKRVRPLPGIQPRLLSHPDSILVIHCPHTHSFGAPKFMGTIRNAYKFVVGQPSDLDVKGMKTAVKQHIVKEYIGFNSLGIWSSGGALMNLVTISEFVQISDHRLPKKHTAPFR
jgi:hypothetical protein